MKKGVSAIDHQLGQWRQRWCRSRMAADIRCHIACKEMDSLQGHIVTQSGGNRCSKGITCSHRVNDFNGPALPD